MLTAGKYAQIVGPHGGPSAETGTRGERHACRLWIRLLVATTVFGCPACERDARDSAAAPSTTLGRSPLNTIERLIEAREAGSYQAIGELTVPERGHQVVQTLMAVDDFLHANRTLCDYVRDEFALGLSQSVDQSHWGARLEIFSRYVELIDQQIVGETATVSFTIDGRLPVRRAHLARTHDTWRYDPGGGYDPRLPEAFRRMARGLRQVLEDLKSGRLAAQEIRAEPERLVEEVRVRLLPGVKMLPVPPGTQATGD